MLTASELARVLDIGLPAGRENTALELAVAATIEAVQAYTGREWAEITDDTEPTARTYPGCASVVLIADVEVADTIVEESSDMTTWTELAADRWHLRPLNDATANRLHRYDGNFARWVRVTGRHGVFEVPAAVRQAAVLMAGRIYDRRLSTSGVTYGGEFGPIRVSRFEDPEVARLLDSVSRPALGIA